MSTYVFSDVHGHRAALERALAQVSPQPDDCFYCLGDMVDRGPDPIGVLSLLHDMPHCTVLMGNHEALMLSCLRDPNDATFAMEWVMNGGATTSEGLDELTDEQCDEVLTWVRGLPLWAHVNVGGRDYILTHAGIDPGRAWIPEEWTEASIARMMQDQLPDDLIWIREDFWGRPTGLVDENGVGPIVVAGHTPTPYLDRMADRPDRPGLGPDLRAHMVRVGACKATGGVSDRWDIDAGAAGGSDFGQVLIVRLDDGHEFYEPVLAGE